MYQKGYQEYDTAVSSVTSKGMFPFFKAFTALQSMVKTSPRHGHCKDSIYTTCTDPVLCLLVKGIGFTCDNLSVNKQDCLRKDVRVWDTADYVVPPQENNAFFLVTNSLQTNHQTQNPSGWFVTHSAV